MKSLPYKRTAASKLSALSYLLVAACIGSQVWNAREHQEKRQLKQFQLSARNSFCTQLRLSKPLIPEQNISNHEGIRGFDIRPKKRESFPSFFGLRVSPLGYATGFRGDRRFSDNRIFRLNLAKDWHLGSCDVAFFSNYDVCQATTVNRRSDFSIQHSRQLGFATRFSFGSMGLSLSGNYNRASLYYGPERGSCELSSEKKAYAQAAIQGLRLGLFAHNQPRCEFSYHAYLVQLHPVAPVGSGSGWLQKFCFRRAFQYFSIEVGIALRGQFRGSLCEHRKNGYFALRFHSPSQRKQAPRTAWAQNWYFKQPTGACKSMGLATQDTMGDCASLIADLNDQLNAGGWKKPVEVPAPASEGPSSRGVGVVTAGLIAAGLAKKRPVLTPAKPSESKSDVVIEQALISNEKPGIQLMPAETHLSIEQPWSASPTPSGTPLLSTRASHPIFGSTDDGQLMEGIPTDLGCSNDDVSSQIGSGSACLSFPPLLSAEAEEDAEFFDPDEECHLDQQDNQPSAEAEEDAEFFDVNEWIPDLLEPDDYRSVALRRTAADLPEILQSSRVGPDSWQIDYGLFETTGNVELNAIWNGGCWGPGECLELQPGDSIVAHQNNGVYPATSHRFSLDSPGHQAPSPTQTLVLASVACHLWSKYRKW